MLCQNCHIHTTTDPYAICAECRHKAAAWPGLAGDVYRQRIARLESPTPSPLPHEPDDREFARLMRW